MITKPTLPQALCRRKAHSYRMVYNFQGLECSHKHRPYPRLQAKSGMDMLFQLQISRVCDTQPSIRSSSVRLQRLNTRLKLRQQP